METADLNRMYVAVLSGMTFEESRSADTPEARTLWNQLSTQVCDMKRRGITPDIPFEIPDLSTGDKEPNFFGLKGSAPKVAAPTPIQQIVVKLEAPPKEEISDEHIKQIARREARKANKRRPAPPPTLTPAPTSTVVTKHVERDEDGRIVSVTEVHESEGDSSHQL